MLTRLRKGGSATVRRREQALVEAVLTVARLTDLIHARRCEDAGVVRLDDKRAKR
jgi:hypothetical protein